MTTETPPRRNWHCSKRASRDTSAAQRRPLCPLSPFAPLGLLAPTGRDVIAQGKRACECSPGFARFRIPSPVRAKWRALHHAVVPPLQGLNTVSPKTQGCAPSSLTLGYNISPRWGYLDTHQKNQNDTRDAAFPQCSTHPSLCPFLTSNLAERDTKCRCPSLVALFVLCFAVSRKFVDVGSFCCQLGTVLFFHRAVFFPCGTPLF